MLAMSKDLRDKILTEVKNTHDLADETLHRAVAATEHAKRDSAGDAMTITEKIASGANEIKHRTEAELDAAKRKLRGH